MRNAVYTGPWLTHAKSIFSKTGCPAYKVAQDYVTGKAIRQEILETALVWISNGKVEHYMSTHQHCPNANELWTYFQNVINWVKLTFPKYRKEMKGLSWGVLYNAYKDETYDTHELEAEILRLIADDDVTSHKGIYPYILTRAEKHLNLRAFTDTQKRRKYEQQKGLCAKCKKRFQIEEMEGDHIKPWSEGGKTEEANLQMLCKACNRQKSNH